MKYFLRSILPAILLATSSIVYAEVQVVDAVSADDGTVSTSEVTKAPAAQPSSTGSVSDRVSRLERQMASRNDVDLLSQVQQQQKQIEELRGQLEVQSHDLKQLQDLQKQQYQDLDQRVSKTSAAAESASKADVAAADKATTKPVKAAKATTTAKTVGEASAEAAKASTVSATDSVMNLPDNAASKEQSGSDQLQEEKAYQTAYDQLRNRKYKEAKSSLQKFVKKYPSGSYSTNAHYWLGELYLLQNQPDLAITEFKTVLKGNPSKAKLADANLKIGFAYCDKGQTQQARTQLQMVKKQYPGTLAAQMATERLQQL